MLTVRRMYKEGQNGKSVGLYMNECEIETVERLLCRTNDKFTAGV